jgi:hypothetical protein
VELRPPAISTETNRRVLYCDTIGDLGLLYCFSYEVPLIPTEAEAGGGLFTTIWIFLLLELGIVRNCHAKFVLQDQDNSEYLVLSRLLMVE